MEQNDKNTLQEMQEQFNLLHSKLENQTILDDKQLARIPRMRIKSMKAVSSFWLVLAIVILILIDGFYGLYYYSLIHIDKVVNYFETTYMAPIDSIINLPSDQLSPELQERLKNMNPEQVEQIRESHAQFRRTLDWYKSETINNPEGMQEAIENVKSAIYGGWILVLNSYHRYANIQYTFPKSGQNTTEYQFFDGANSESENDAYHQLRNNHYADCVNDAADIDVL